MISSIRETPLYILRNTMKKHGMPKEDIAYDSDSKKPWNEEEELRLILAHKQYKNRWADVAEAMKGRSGNNIKNKFYSIFRKVKGKIAKNDYSYTSQLELLEIRYMSTLMLHYFAHPIVRVKTKGKRGKDFIYSLICNLSLDSVNNYTKCLSDMTKAKGSLEELFDTLEKQILSKTSGSGKSNSRQNIKEETKDISQEYALKRQKKEDESFLNIPSMNQRLRNIEPWENSPLFPNVGYALPYAQSPTNLSAGPAAAAAKATFAECFSPTALVPTGGFSQLSNEVRQFYNNEEAIRNPIQSRLISMPYRQPIPIRYVSTSAGIPRTFIKNTPFDASIFY